MRLKRYDIIKKVDGKTINKSDELIEIVANMKPKQKIELLVYRNGKNIKLSGKIGEKP